MNDDREYVVHAPGWAAIDRAFARHYPRQIPHQFSSRTPYELDSPNPLPAISVYEANHPCAWHFVSHGLSELFEKTSNIADTSGFGFELTFRLRREPDQAMPPEEALRMLQALGRYVLESRTGFDTGHVLDLGGPILQGCDTALTGFLCVPDPQLGQIDTVHGALLFLLLFGVTSDELEAFQGVPMERIVGFVHEASELGTTDTTRRSIFADPKRAPIARRWQLGIGLG